MKLRFVVTIVAALGAIATGAALAANPGPSPSITGGVLGAGASIVPNPITVHLSLRNGFVTENATFPPGTTAGWHYHTTPLTVAVTAGTLTLYDSSGPKCTPHRYHAGQGFVEPAYHVHLARNEGKTAVKLILTYVYVPPSLRANPTGLDVFGQNRPRKCPASVH